MIYSIILEFFFYLLILLLWLKRKKNPKSSYRIIFFIILLLFTIKLVIFHLKLAPIELELFSWIFFNICILSIITQAMSPENWHEG